MMKVYLYEVFLSCIIYCLLCYFMTILTPFYMLDFWYLSHSRNICQTYLSQKSTRIHINGGGKSC